MTHTVVGGGDPAPGKTIEYTGTFTIAKMKEQGTTTTTTIIVSADPNAPFVSPVTAADFSGNSAAPKSITCNSDNTSCTVTFENLSDGVITFKKRAQIKTTAPAGTTIYATADIRTNVAPTLTLQSVAETFTPDAGRCSGTITFTSRVAGAGAWLMDIKFADKSGGKVTADPWSSPGNSLQVTGPNGADITAQVLAGMTYRADDPVPPTFPQSTITNATWADSLNWKWDPTSWTGDTWIPAGSTITIKRHVTYLNCLPGGFAGDFDTNRMFGMAIEMARPQTSVEDFAMVGIRLPGSISAPARCEQNIYFTENRSIGTGNENSRLGYFTPNPGAASQAYTMIGPANSAYYDAIAISRQQDTKIYYSTRAPRLMSYDTATGVHTDVMALPGVTNALGFDKDGNLWTIDTSGGIYRLNWNGTSLATQWTRVGTMSGIGTGSARDLAFDGDGNMYLLGGTYGEVLYRASAAQLAAGGTITPANWGTHTTSPASPTTEYYGLAFNSKGNLIVANYAYAGGTEPFRSKIFERDPLAGPSGTWTTYINGNYSPDGRVADLATCNYPSTTVPKDGFQVQKSVINADGTVSPAGTTGQRVTVAADGSILVRYLVQVTNIGATAGTHPVINDKVTVPAGFTIEDVALNGTSQGKTGTFTIPAANLAGGAVASHVVTLKLKANLSGTVDWASAGTCNTQGAGTPGTGFFNVVTMDKDADGADNNDACVPVQQPQLAKLTLIKDIVNGSATDSRYFTLTAVNPASSTGISGSSPSSGQVAVSSNVTPGRYILGENANHDGAGQYTTGTWTCNAGKTVGTDNSISLVNGDNVTCRINNTYAPPVHVIKTPTQVAPAEQNNPPGVNPHIGAVVEADADGKLTLNYTITVVNDGTAVGATGPVNEYFSVPAGLLWQSGATATITFDANGTGAQAVGFNPSKTYTEAELRDGYTLATSITGLQPGTAGAVKFNISIPLMLNNTKAPNFAGTVFEQNETRLGQCVSTTTGGAAHSNNTMGVPNVTSIYQENQAYSPIPTQDNLACIPVIKRVVGGATWEKVGVPNPTKPDQVVLLGESEWELTPVTGNGGTATGPSVKVTDCIATDVAQCSGPDKDIVAGKFAVQDMQLGWYRLVETKAPLGFHKDETPRYFEVTKSTLTVNVGQVHNELVDTQTLPKTGGMGVIPMIAIGGLIILGGALYGRRRNAH
ncbi:hypothetical protein GCM10027595_06570 [Corynebacterium nasicanis]